MIIAAPDQFVVFTDGKEIRGMTLDSRSSGVEDVFKPLMVDGNAAALDYDAIDGYIYWTNTINGTISRSTLKGGTKVILSGLVNPEGLAVDWITRNIYYTDDGINIIGMVTFDGNYSIVIINEDLQSPREIAIDPEQGLDILQCYLII